MGVYTGSGFLLRASTTPAAAAACASVPSAAVPVLPSHQQRHLCFRPISFELGGVEVVFDSSSSSDSAALFFLLRQPVEFSHGQPMSWSHPGPWKKSRDSVPSIFLRTSRKKSTGATGSRDFPRDRRDPVKNRQDPVKNHGIQWQIYHDAGRPVESRHGPRNGDRASTAAPGPEASTIIRQRSAASRHHSVALG